MIASDNWVLFISSFFGVEVDWVDHVTTNWNHLKNEPGCQCSLINKEVMPCKEYEEIKAAKLIMSESFADSVINVDDSVEI